MVATKSLSDDMVNLFANELGAEVRLVDPGAEQEEILKVLKLIWIPLERRDHRLSQLWVTWTTANLAARSHSVIECRDAKLGVSSTRGAYQVERGGQPHLLTRSARHRQHESPRSPSY